MFLRHPMPRRPSRASDDTWFSAILSNSLSMRLSVSTFKITSSAAFALAVKVSPIKAVGSSGSSSPSLSSRRYSLAPSLLSSSQEKPACSTHIQYPSSLARRTLSESSEFDAASTKPRCANAKASALRSGIDLACLWRSSPM